jgi:S1-C subfamily serine protease
MKRTVVLMLLLLVAVMPALAQEETPEPVAPEPFLGVQLDPDSEQAVVINVVPMSAAGESGLQDGDIILAIDGDEVTRETISDVLRSSDVGDTLTLTIERDGDEIDLGITPGPRPMERARGQDRPFRPMRGGGFLGVQIDDADNGVTVVAVEPESAAAEIGLQEGDVIVSFNGEDVDDPRDLSRAVRQLPPGETITLTVERGDETLTLEGELGQRGRGMRVIPPMLGDDLRFDAETNAWDVVAVGEGSLLADAGIQAGDRITAVNGESLDNLRGLLQGEMITLTIERDGDTFDVEVPPAAVLPLLQGRFDLRPSMERPDMFRDRNRAFLGVGFEIVDGGAQITEVVPGSPADEAGLQVDDIVLAVDGDDVDAERTLSDRLFAYEIGDTVTLDVARGDEIIQIEVTLTGR